MKIYKIPHPHDYEWQYWFNSNPGERVWYAARFDKEENQIGDSINAYDKETIILLIGMNWM